MSDTSDLVLLAETYLRLRRCAGGRLLVDGYCCPHCGSDDPRKICKGHRRNKSRALEKVAS
jgi:hypothetical protein